MGHQREGRTAPSKETGVSPHTRAVTGRDTPQQLAELGTGAGRCVIGAFRTVPGSCGPDSWGPVSVSWSFALLWREAPNPTWGTLKLKCRG